MITEKEQIKRITIKNSTYRVLSVAAFLLGIFTIITPGLGFFIGIAAIIIALVDISRELYIYDRVWGIWLDIYAIVMGFYGILEMFF
jgi:hypothetical protein